MNSDDDGWGSIEEVGQQEDDREEKPEVETDTDAKPSAKRDGEVEEGCGIAEVITRSTASIVIAILPNQLRPFGECSVGL